jgi:hypothetical protein
MDDKKREIFEKIREEPLNNPEKLGDKDNRCWGKHRRLKELLEKEGYEIRFRVCSFKWSQQRFPETILEIPHKDDDYHLYLEIKVNNKWIIIDCSNDSKLPVYNVWDGMNDCKIAVNYDKLFSPRESSKREREELEGFPKLIKENENFYISINKFFDNLRKHQS